MAIDHAREYQLRREDTVLCDMHKALSTAMAAWKANPTGEGLKEAVKEASAEIYLWLKFNHPDYYEYLVERHDDAGEEFLGLEGI